MFQHDWKATTGKSFPGWLVNSNEVSPHKNNRPFKFDPLAEEFEFLECDPNYGPICLTEGRKDTVSLRNLAWATERLTERPSEPQENEEKCGPR